MVDVNVNLRLNILWVNILFQAIEYMKFISLLTDPTYIN